MWNESGCSFGGRVGHARVAVAEHHDLVEADDLGRALQLARAQLGQQRLLLLGRQPVERLAGLAQVRVLQVALLAAGAAHEHGAHALRLVHRQRGRALRRLVVGVGVDGQDAQRRVAHRVESIGPRRVGVLHRTATGPYTAAHAVAGRSRRHSSRPSSLVDHRVQRRRTHAAPCPLRPGRQRLHAGTGHRPDHPATASTTGFDDNAALDTVSIRARRSSAGPPRRSAATCWPSPSSFEDGRPIPARHTCQGENVSPALSWSPAPADTVEIAITMVDLDAPNFVHWAIAGIDPLSTSLGEGVVPEFAIAGTERHGRARATPDRARRPARPTRTAFTVHYLDQQTELGEWQHPVPICSPRSRRRPSRVPASRAPIVRAECDRYSQATDPSHLTSSQSGPIHRITRCLRCRSRSSRPTGTAASPRPTWRFAPWHWAARCRRRAPRRGPTPIPPTGPWPRQRGARPATPRPTSSSSSGCGTATGGCCGCGSTPARSVTSSVASAATPASPSTTPRRSASACCSTACWAWSSRRPTPSSSSTATVHRCTPTRRHARCSGSTTRSTSSATRRSAALLQTIRDQVPRELLTSSATSQWSGEVGFRGPGRPRTHPRRRPGHPPRRTGRHRVLGWRHPRRHRSQPHAEPSSCVRPPTTA